MILDDGLNYCCFLLSNVKNVVMFSSKMYIIWVEWWFFVLVFVLYWLMLGLLGILFGSDGVVVLLVIFVIGVIII